MKSYPTQFECVGVDGSVLFKIETFDEYCANVQITTVVSKKSWPEISAEIARCLDAMELIG